MPRRKTWPRQRSAIRKTATPDLYRCELTAIRARIAWRPAASDWLAQCPSGNGTLTAIVVGAGQPTHTDRDGRVRVQFSWQRGGQSAARQAHPTGADNAPASATLGVWLRVMAPVAGSNWGGHLTPRPGQEVVVAFQNGNIDRPVIVGSVYNGQGSADAQGNQIGSGTMQASANAPAFFAGPDATPHTHGASLFGLKSRMLKGLGAISMHNVRGLFIRLEFQVLTIRLLDKALNAGLFQDYPYNAALLQCARSSAG